MERIRQDTRHTDVRIVEDRHVAARGFEQWSLAYCGPDSFIDGQLTEWLQRGTNRTDRDIAATLRERLRSMAEVA